MIGELERVSMPWWVLLEHAVFRVRSRQNCRLAEFPESKILTCMRFVPYLLYTRSTLLLTTRARLVDHLSSICTTPRMDTPRPVLAIVFVFLERWQSKYSGLAIQVRAY